MSDLAPKIGLTAFEMASGFVGGGMPGAEPLPQPARGLSALDALEEATLPALRRGPCFVSFSGGRDSSPPPPGRPGGRDWPPRCR
jgi:hypothetical protein